MSSSAVAVLQRIADVLALVTDFAGRIDDVPLIVAYIAPGVTHVVAFVADIAAFVAYVLTLLPDLLVGIADRGLGRLDAQQGRGGQQVERAVNPFGEIAIDRFGVRHVEFIAN